MRILNTMDRMADCFVDGRFSMSAWQKYIGRFSPQLAEKCRQDAMEYDFERDVLPVLNAAAADGEKLRELRDSFDAVTGRLRQHIGKLFAEEPEIDIILYLGLCNGAGWATVLDGRDVALLGIEKIIELGWQDEERMQALVFHEIGHIWHKLSGHLELQASSASEKSLKQLYQEGIAMRCEQILCQNDNLYRRDKGGWLDWCRENLPGIKREYARRVQSGEGTQDFFGDWHSYQGYSDVGYYLGCEFIKYLEKGAPLIQIAKLSLPEVGRAFDAFAREGRAGS